MTALSTNPAKQAALLTIFVLLLSATTPAVGQSANYKVHLDFSRPLHARVEADLEAPDGLLFTAEHAGGYAWWDFIKNPRQILEGGTSIPLQPARDGHWTLPDRTRSRSRIEYDVDLSFAEKVREGDLRGGLFFGDSLYIVNRALFLMSNASGIKEVEFDTPPGFAIATPWQKASHRHFRASDNEQLSANWTIVGNFPAVEFSEGQFQVTFAFPGVSAAEQSLLQPLFTPVLHEYLRIFPQTPATHLFFAFFHAWQIGGEGYSNSATLTMVDPITVEDRILWTNLLAHEIFHHWNGGLVSPADDDKSAWFYEGATEYMANRTIIRTGLISQELFLKKLEIHVGMYDYWMWAPPFQKSTLQSAVRDGGGDKDVNRPAIYNGGVVASFCLDTMIQKQTAGKKNLEDLLGLMMTRYGLSGKPYSPDDLIHDASEVAGTDLSSFFSRYIASRERLPVKECFAEAGLNVSVADYAGEAFITPQANPSPQALGIRQQLLRVVKQ